MYSNCSMLNLRGPASRPLFPLQQDEHLEPQKLQVQCDSNTNFTCNRKIKEHTTQVVYTLYCQSLVAVVNIKILLLVLLNVMEIYSLSAILCVIDELLMVLAIKPKN